MAKETTNSLVSLIRSYPIIDQHAHPLLKKSDHGEASEPYHLEQITSEAHGAALNHVWSSLSHIRGVKQLSKLFKCEETWAAVKEKRATRSDEELAKECLTGIQTILLDDGLGDPTQVHENKWHDSFVRSPTKRIVRIESVAESVLQEVFHDEGGNPPNEIFDSFIGKFTTEIDRCLDDENVVGFKSVICYRSGLQIDVDVVLPDDIYSAISKVRASSKDGQKLRIDHKSLNDFLILKVSSLMKAKPRSKPIQFHTGLGDNDLTLRLSNPACMQPYIKAHPNIPVVLLHSGYPYVREAGYLATMYDNVYLDFGEVFPFVSRDGQEDIIKQVMELTPSTKLMWSTDGHWFPETYWLATTQIRLGLESVLLEMVAQDDIGVADGIQLVKNVLFDTANKLYSLNLTPTLDADVIESTSSSVEDLVPLQTFLRRHPGVKYIRLNWINYCGNILSRVMNRPYYQQNLKKGKVHIGIPKATDFLLHGDSPATGLDPVGEFELQPDFSSVRLHPRGRNTKVEYANVNCYLREENNTPQDLCIRTVLSNTLAEAEKLGLKLKIGFEIEFVILDLEALRKPEGASIKPFRDVHSWSYGRALQSPAQDIIEEIIEALEDADIEVMQYHAESAPSQFEIITGPLEPMAAVDSLLHTRETIFWICEQRGVRATLIPKPFADTAGTASHVHISLEPAEKHWNFFAGVLDHLEQICAFTFGGNMSYKRLKAGYWAGGTWAYWGRQNREAPLRLVDEKEGHWEIKCVDGLANVYLAVAAIIRAGCIGVKDGYEIDDECNVDANFLSDKDREDRGIETALPKSLEEAFSNLDDEFTEALGKNAVEHYKKIKMEEDKMLSEMDENKRLVYLAERF